MNSNEIDSLQCGLPLEPRSNQTNDAISDGATPAPTPSPAVVLSNEVDEFGIVTVSIWNPTSETNVEIRLLRDMERGLIVDEIPRNGILHATCLRPQMKLLFLNGCDCAEMLVAEAMLMMDSTVGELVIMAAANTSTSTSNAENSTNLLAACALAAMSDDVYDSYASPAPILSDDMAFLTRSTPIHPMLLQPPSVNHDQSAATVVKVVIQKPGKRTSLGLSIVNELTRDGGGTSTVPAIRHIDPHGPCANTALKVGMRILSVNGLRCYTKDDTMTKLKRAKTLVYLEAEPLSLPNNNSGNMAATTTTSMSQPTPSHKPWWCRKRNHGPTLSATTTTAATPTSSPDDKSPALSPTQDGEMA